MLDILIEFYNTTMAELNIWSVMIRVFMAVIFAGLIGFERETKRHPAGFRTHILVSVGSALVMMIGIFMSEKYDTDPTRISAQVISGIGFLGAGTIILGGGHIRGVTTAAGLWASAAMGLAIGAGFYEGAIIAFITIFSTIWLFRKIHESIVKHYAASATLEIILKSRENIEYITNLITSWSIDISSVSFETQTGTDNSVNLTLDVFMKNNIDNNTTMVNLMKESCVLSAKLSENKENNSL